MFKRRVQDLVTLEPTDLTQVDPADTITRASRHVGNMVTALHNRRGVVQEQLDALNEEMRQIEHVLNYAEPMLVGITGGRDAN